MNQNIKYQGISVTPSDYETTDGQLSLALNLINEDGSIKPVNSPAEVEGISIPEGNSVIYIHKISNFNNYICYDSESESICAIGKDDVYNLGTISDVTHCSAIGNTLIVFSDNSTHYFLWKSNKYIPLGSHIPDIQLSLGLIGHPRRFSNSDSSKSEFTINFADGIDEDKIKEDFNEANRNRITEQIMAKLNMFIADQSINKGRFCFPFLVRYAIRMYDGSLIAHSNPILMNPHTTPAPIVLWNRVRGKKRYTEAVADILLVAADLDYQVILTDDFDRLSNWSDLITSVDIFISKPLYTYDQSGTVNNLVDTDNFDSVFIGRIAHTLKNDAGEIKYASSVTEDAVLAPMAENQSDRFLNCYAEWQYSRIYQLYFNRSYPSETFHLPEFSAEKIGESIRSCAQFYLLHSIPLSELTNQPGKRKTIPINDDYLQSLVTREVMSDDYLSRDALAASDSQIYNGRLNLSGIKRYPFAGFSPSSMFAFTDRYISNWVKDANGVISLEPYPSSDRVTITIILQEGDKIFHLASGGWAGAFLSPSISDSKIKRSTGCFITYPNVNATHAIITSNLSTNRGTFIVNLKPHEFLNASYALLDYAQIREDNQASQSVPEANTSPYGNSSWIDVPNKVYTSEVNNPFQFPATGINTIGTGKILGIATAAKALSQGQFGQFPLYAFTDEGVWAMEVSSTGSFSARQPITRDVCINPKGITQIDSAVLFPTNRGIMLLSGSEAQCISDAILNHDKIDFNSLKGISVINSFLSRNNENYLSIDPFIKFISKGGMLYDYTHQRIIIYNTAYPYAYIYSFKSQLWAMIQSDIRSGINSYPDAMAVNNEGRLVNFSSESEQFPGGILITRPINLGDPDVLKTISTIIQRGRFKRGHIQSILYGSRDLSHWHIVWSSRDHYLRGFHGSPYKYFRIALQCSLSSEESIFGASVDFIPRDLNQIR